MFDRQVSISMTARLVSFNRKSAAAVLWGRKLQCSLLHLNKYIKKESEEELGFHSNWHLSNGGDELEGIRLENDIFASWRVRIDPVSYPITARAVVQAFAIQHKSASQTTTGCRTSPQTSQEVDLMNTCPPPRFFTTFPYTSRVYRSDAAFAWNSEAALWLAACNTEKSLSNL